MGRSTTEKIAGKQDVTNSQLMLPEHAQGGGVMSIHEPYFVILIKKYSTLKRYYSISLLIYHSKDNACDC